MKLVNYPVYNLTDLLVANESLKRKYTVEFQDKWETTKPAQSLNAVGLGNLLYEFHTETSITLVISNPEAILVVESYTSNSDIHTAVYTTDLDTAKRQTERVKGVIPVAPEPNEGDISVRFWYLSQNGPRSMHRNIAAPKWDTIDKNYTSKTRSGLNQLMDGFVPSAGGQLVLWHGEPGTGKTYALRALCQAWKDWCSVQYVLDPETLLGQSPGYLASMIMNEDNILEEDDDEPKKTWKLLIMEDTGELLTEHAQERSGQGLARLLNVVDGFIGQGLRVLVLITTNEEFEKLHPAVSREGRCAASIKFAPLQSREINEFLLKNNTTEKFPANKLGTIAELYAFINKQESPRDLIGIGSKSLGFRAPIINGG
jgi:hypothetical protein